MPMPQAPDDAAIARALAARNEFADIDRTALIAMPVRGLVHAHWRVAGRGVVVRAPRALDPGLDAQAALARQAAAFRRAYASGVTPRLIDVISPSADMPLGALLVEEIIGAPPRLPNELGAIATSLAAIHDLAVPSPADRPPLADWPDHFAATLATIERNAVYLDTACRDDVARRAFDDELAWARDFARRQEAALSQAPRALTVIDAHPGNFVMSENSAAIFVDLEKAGYGTPAIDLAHATLALALAWGGERAPLSHAAIAAFYREYFDRRGGTAARSLAAYLLPFRRLVWLRTTMAFARFAAEGAAATLAPPHSTNAADAVAMAFDPAAIARQRAEWLDPQPLRLD